MPQMTHTVKPTNGHKRVRIAIADGHALFRSGLRRLLEVEPGFQVIGEAADGIEATAIARRARPDILLLEVALPRSSGLRVLRELSCSPPVTHPLLLVASIEDAQLLEALCLGARGVVLKSAATSLLVKGIRAVVEGEYWLQRDRVSLLVRALNHRGGAGGNTIRHNMFGLKPRELEIVAAIAAGDSTREMARAFSRSEVTIRHQLTGIFRKLGVRNRMELATFAVNHNLAGDASSGLTPPTEVRAEA